MDVKTMAEQRFDIGRALIFVHGTLDGDTIVPSVWDGTTPLWDSMHHIGTTVGEISLEANPEFSDLTVETTGPAILKRYLAGESPSFTMDVYPTLDLMKTLSPTAYASAGQELRPRVREMTMWIAPEELFIETAADGTRSYVDVTYAAGNFLKDAGALTAEEEELLDLSTLIWKATTERLTPAYRMEAGGESRKTITVNVLQDFDRPNGCQLFLVLGERAETAFSTIDFAGGS